MFIGYQNDKIAFVAETREELENIPCVTLDKIEETGVEYVLKDGKYVLKADAEAMQAEEDKQARISELKQLLANTDYIDNKFLEAIVKEDAELLNTLKVKYKDKLEERQAIRNQIDKLEETL